MTAEDTVQMGGVRFLEGKRQIKHAYKIKQILSIIEYSNKIEKSEDIYEVGYR